MARFEPGNERRVLIDLPSLTTTPPVAPQTGYALKFSDFNISEAQGQEAIEVLENLGVPFPEVDGTKPVSGSFELPFGYDWFPYVVRHAVADFVTTGAGPDYTHTATLGDQTNVILPAFACEAQLLQATPVSYILYHGLRMSSWALNFAVSGGIMSTFNVEGLREEDPSTTAVADTVTSFTDDPVSSTLLTAKVDTVDVLCNIESFGFELNSNLAADDYALFQGGRRCALNRGVPTLTGTMNMFADDDTLDYITGTRTTPRTAYDFEIKATESASRDMTIALNNAKLFLQGEPVPTSQGWMVNFNWSASGAGCMVVTIVNQTASY